MRTAYRPAATIAVVMLLAGCGGGGATTTTTVATTTTTVATTTTTVATTTTATGGGDVLVIPAAAEMDPAWTETLLVAYGEGDELLGTAPGGDSGSLDLGPEYGAQAGDGTWWFLDAAKRRIAHYAADGSYLESVPVPAELLTDGVYFQYQLPRVLDDGTVVATGLGSETTRVLLVEDGVASGATVPGTVGVMTDDGDLLFGWSFDPPGAVAVDLDEGTTTETEWFGARDGSRFRIAAEGDRLRVEMPDAGFDRTFTLEAGVGGPAFASVEAATGEDGSLHLLLIGLAGDDESVQLAGYLRIGGDGSVGAVEGVRDPFGPSDPGSPAHLGIRPGSSDPWLMFVDEDGVRVFTRS